MSEDVQPPQFLLDHFPFGIRQAHSGEDEAPASTSRVRRPHITVTWAQSLDAKIAGPNGSRVILSGPESMLMTHWMRGMHDAILIGINTLVLDDPRLQANLLPQQLKIPNPQPLILDPHLRFPLKARILSEWTKNMDNPESKAKQPWIICGDDVSSEKRRLVEDAGARVICLLLKEGRIEPTSLLDLLGTIGLRSVMIEGGSRILSAFLRASRRSDGSPLVDSVVITVAPMLLGEGIRAIPLEEEQNLPSLRNVHTETMGKDTVMVCTINGLSSVEPS